MPVSLPYDFVMNKREAFQTLAHDLEKGELVFPTNARLALKLRHALSDPDCHLETAVQLIQAEPLLSARVIAMANSVAFNRSGREIADVRSSVMRLGFGSVRLLAMALVTRQLAGSFGADSGRNAATQLWEHSAQVASLARVIAQRVTGVDADAAMFAGIVHEIGGFYLLSRARSFPGLLDGDFSDWIEYGEPAVGRAVLKALEMPEAVLDAIEEYWSGRFKIPPGSLGDTLLLSDELAKVSSPLRPYGANRVERAMKANVDQAISWEELTSILAESAEEVASLARALRF